MLDPKHKVKQDIKTYERNKQIRRLGTLGVLGSAGAAAIGGFKEKPHILFPALATAFASGFAHQRARSEERSALNRIKRYYDLRETPKLINFDAVIPEDKTAAIGGLEQLIMTGNPVPLAIDMAALGPIATITSKAQLNNAVITAKDSLGIPLTPGERTSRGLAQIGLGLSEAVKKIPQNPIPFDTDIKEIFKNPSLLIPGGVVRNVAGHGANIVSALTGARAAKSSEDYVVPMMKKIEKVSPELNRLLLRAGKEQASGPPAVTLFGKKRNIPGLNYVNAALRWATGHGPEETKKPATERLTRIFKQRREDAEQAAKILKDTVEEIPALKHLSESGGVGIESYLKRYAKNPHFASESAQTIRTKALELEEVRKGLEQIGDKILHEIPGGHRAARLLGNSSADLGKTLLHDPKKLLRIGEQAFDTVRRTRSGVESGLAAAALGIVGGAIGSYRFRHPLATDDLPSSLIDKKRDQPSSPSSSSSSYGSGGSVIRARFGPGSRTARISKKR